MMGSYCKYLEFPLNSKQNLVDESLQIDGPFTRHGNGARRHPTASNGAVGKWVNSMADGAVGHHQRRRRRENALIDHNVI